MKGVTGVKKKYERPAIDIEFYEIDDAIAAGCVTIYTLYPENPSDPDKYYPTCYSDYETLSLEAAAAATISTPFMNEDCSCYYGSGNAPCLSS